MHVGDEQVHQAIQVPIKKLDPHGAPGRFGEIGGGLLPETLALIVFVILIVALHVEHVEIGVAVLVQIAERRVAAPAAMLEIHFFGHVLELPAPEIAIENAGFDPFRFEMARKSVRIGQVKTAAPLLVTGINPHVHQE